MRRLRALCLLACLAVAPAHADDAAAWLAKIGPALRGLDYQGTLVYLAEGRIETMRVFHREDDGRERERLVAVNGPAREVVRDGERVLCIGTARGAVSYAAASGRWSDALALADVAALRGYRATLGGAGRVAGHEAQVVDVPARDAWRYGYRLWLERDTGLPLRVDLLDASGEAIEQVAFTALEFVEPADADLAPPRGARAVPMSTASARSAEPARWEVPAPPPGYALRTTRSRGDGVQMLFSDGLASVSVYVERAGDGIRGVTTSRRGAVNARAYVVDGWRVLAIGKVPLATVDHFARTLQAADADG